MKEVVEREEGELDSGRKTEDADLQDQPAGSRVSWLFLLFLILSSGSDQQLKLSTES